MHAAHAAAPWRALFRRPATPPPAPADNPLTPDRIALGAKLFADPRLSGSGRRSCASCHRPELAFTDGRRRAQALSGAPLRRNTPSLWNLAWSKHYFWDGRAPSLEAQVRMPIEAADEMGGDWPAILARLEADADLARRFREAFGRRAADLAGHGREGAGGLRALAGLAGDQVRCLDRGRCSGAERGRVARLSACSPARPAACSAMPAGASPTTASTTSACRASDPGRGAVPGGTPGLSAFKTPSLRELAHTAPYMHDGSLPTLAAVVAHYAGGFVARPTSRPT